MGSDHCQGQRDISSHGSVQACLPAYINYSELIGFSVSLLCRSSAKKDFEVGLRVAKSLNTQRYTRTASRPQHHSLLPLA